MDNNQDKLSRKPKSERVGSKVILKFMKAESKEMKDMIENFKSNVISTSGLYALKGGTEGTGTNDEETGCGADNRCDDCKADAIIIKVE